MHNAPQSVMWRVSTCFMRAYVRSPTVYKCVWERVCLKGDTDNNCGRGSQSDRTNANT